MGKPLTGVKGVAEIASLAAILALSANANVNIKSIYYDHVDDLLKQGPEGARTAVVVTGAPLVFNNMYGTSVSSSQDEETADAPVQFGDDDNFYGDDSEITKITHSDSFEGVYNRTDLYWTTLRTAAGSQGIARLCYFRFFPEGKKGLAEVRHGVIDPRGLSGDFPRDDFFTFSVDLPYKGRRYEHALPTVYPPA